MSAERIHDGSYQITVWWLSRAGPCPCSVFLFLKFCSAWSLKWTAPDILRSRLHVAIMPP